MEVTLIFPHQLFRPHPAVQSGRKIWLIEDPLFLGTDRHWPMRMHWQKRLLHRASLVEYAEELRRAGHESTLVQCPSTPSTTGEILRQVLPSTTSLVHVVDPVDDVLQRRLQRWARESAIRLNLLPSPNFLTPSDLLAEHFQGSRKPYMARFYSEQRQRLNVLLNPDGTPQGGRWSFDSENRKKLPARIEVPPIPTLSETEFTQRSRQECDPALANGVGKVGPLLYPATRRDAQTWLDQFLSWRLHHFGAYEDAISSVHSVLFHSVLTPSLNLGLLDPSRVIARAVSVAAEQKTALASLEGFVRQIIGWREFIRGAYLTQGVPMRRSNFWGFTRRMPAAFYHGTTGLAPVDTVIRRVHETGYCHHIERLMVLGNIFLLCRIHPDDVYLWFMEHFIDSYDWVMVPNVYGMSQFADGGKFTTKPYLSASNYLLKMSDYARGPWCEIWDALFWTFIADHADVFRANPRLATLTLGLERQRDKLPEHHRRAQAFLEQLK